MSELVKRISEINISENVDKQHVVDDIRTIMSSAGYDAVEIDDKRPWGGYLRFDNNKANLFVGDFFPDLSLDEARLGNSDAELSPKILIVSPNQRLSWQYHNRRAERWAFLTEGCFDKSATDEEQGVCTVNCGDVVQFAACERHRLIGSVASYTVVAEIWQHLNSNNLSDEDDIVRVSDDYSR